MNAGLAILIIAAKKNRLCRLAGLCLLLYACPVSAQNTIGIPSIINYTKQQYNAGRQNWGIVQDNNGIMYFANNDGVLTFDGVFWQLHALPNKTVVRSVAIDKSGRVYAGGQGEIGYFFPDEKGRLAYTSLNQLIPAEENVFTDVWNICIRNDQVFFRSNKRILEYVHGKIVIHKSINWSFLGFAGDQLLARDYEKGLVRYEGGSWEPVRSQGELPAEAMVRAVVQIGKDSLLLPTLSHGIFMLRNDTIKRFSTPDIDAIAKKNIYNAVLLSTGRLALITNLGGCFIVDKSGKYIQQFAKPEGIQNNNILSIIQDKDENIWLGLDNGIDLVTYNNAIKNIFPEQEDRNSGYAAQVHNDYLYIGLSTGLYRAKMSEERDMSYTPGQFKLVKNSKGQVWNLSVVNGRLMMGHTSGAYIVNDDEAVPLDKKTGFWGFQPWQQSSSFIVAGTYNGINFYTDSAGRIRNPVVNAQFESARFIVQHGGIIWAAHPYKGLYKISLQETGKTMMVKYDDRKGILSANHNKIYKIGRRLILTTDNGIFEYNDRENDFVHARDLEAVFEQKNVSYLKEDQFGNIWFSRDRKVGVVDRSGPVARLVYIPELDDKIMAAGFEYIHVADSSNIFIAGEKGFFHINYTAYKKNKYPIRVQIRHVRSMQPGEKGLMYGGYAFPAEEPSVKYRDNGLYFECSAVLYGQADNTQYAYFLEGFDSDWSGWTRKPEKEYTNLPAGSYTFKVKARNNYDNESAVAAYSFTILPPWYQTWWAYSLYIIFIFTALFFFYKLQQYRYKKMQAEKLREQQRKYAEEQEHLKLQHQLAVQENEKQIIELRNEKLQAEIEQKKLQEEQERLHFGHQLQVEQNEKEIVRLRNEKLQAELAHKNTELASSAMNLVRKMEILSRLKEDLINYRNQAETDKGHREFLKILRVLDKELDSREEWEQFAIHFDHVHSNYLQRLQEFCPDLTSSELKLAAYLRLNLNTKEIAQLMNISVRGVETSRYRLRKKLALANDVSLVGFLSAVTR
ncbi:MAG TPA: triple tyrosine motif-containing protein [Chitinophagaceae bacterium]|nr:triple tyrosine motif-containing protein [Chitinophagaceae bacterium]